MEAIKESEKKVTSEHDLSHPLFRLLQLEKEIRKATDKQQLKFIIVNRLRRLIDFQQAVLLQVANNKSEVISASDVNVIDKHAPFIRWMSQLTNEVINKPLSEETGHVITLHRKDLSEKLQQGWDEWVWEHSVCLFLKPPEGSLQGALFLTRSKPFSHYEQVILEHLSETLAHAWAFFYPKRIQWRSSIKKSRVYLCLLALLAASFVIPVKKSSLAPAEVIAQQPSAITAPFDAVVHQILVKPNQLVNVGEPLVTLEDTDFRNKYQMAKEELTIAQVELRKRRQGAFYDAEAKASLAELEAQVDLKTAQLNYSRELVNQTAIAATESGVAIFRDENDWLGRPVAQGEKILYLADPSSVELQIQLPVKDAVVLNKGADIRFFLDINPLEPVDATLVHASYDAEATPDGVMAYLVKARLNDEQEVPRIGLRGTAKLYGDETSLFMYLFRRPLATVRQWLGL